MGTAGVALVVFFVTVIVVCIPFILVVDRVEKRKFKAELDWQAREHLASYTELANRCDTLETAYTAKQDQLTEEIRKRILAEKTLKEAVITAHQEITHMLLERAAEPERVIATTVAKLRYDLGQFVTENMEIKRWTNKMTDTEVFSAQVRLVDLIDKGGLREPVSPA